jgi:hypothetical protein
MKTTTILAAAALASALAGCGAHGLTADGRDLNGFPIDEKCADFHAKSPLYGGNRALAYATNCSSVGGM